MACNIATEYMAGHPFKLALALIIMTSLDMDVDFGRDQPNVRRRDGSLCEVPLSRCIIHVCVWQECVRLVGSAASSYSILSFFRDEFPLGCQ